MISKLQFSQGSYGSWKTWNFVVAFSMTARKRLLVVESSGNQCNSSKKYAMYGRQ